VQQLDAFLAGFEGALGGDDEAAFVQGLADKRSDAVREVAENFFERGQEASRTSEIWEMVGLWLTVFLGLYQCGLLPFHLVSVNVLGCTVLPWCVALLLLLGFRSTGRELLAVTPEWARRWADPSRKAGA